MNWRTFFFVVGLVLLVGGLSWIARETVVEVNTELEFQTVSGWEVTLRLWETNKAQDRFDDSWESHGAEIFDRLVNELGINRVRLEVKSGIENSVDYWDLFQKGEIGYLEYKKHYYEKVNDNDNPDSVDLGGFQFSPLDYQVEKMLLPIRRLVEANGEKLFVNLCYVDFKGTGPQGSLSHAERFEEYAEFISTTFNYLSTKYGVVPDALEIILEPDNTVGWRGQNIGKSLVATGVRLNADGFSPDFIAPSTSHASKAPAYFDEMVAVPGVRDLLTTFSYHRYDPVPDFVTLPRIRNRASANNVRTAMLEYTYADVDQFYADITKANVSAWQQYGIAVRLPDDYDLRIGYFYGLQSTTDGDQEIVLSESGRKLSQYFRYLRAGAVRVGANSNRMAIRPVAFRNIDGSTVVVVHSDRRGSIRIQNLPQGTYHVRYTSTNALHEALPDQTSTGNEDIAVNLPEPGIVTIYQNRLLTE